MIWKTLKLFGDKMHSTTVLAIKKKGKTVIIGDG